MPPLLYIANKAETAIVSEADLLGDFYQKFPGAADDPDAEPLFISAEHGDGLQDLHRLIIDSIPAEKHSQYDERKEKRLARYNEIKQQLLDDIVQIRTTENPDHSSDEEDDLEMFVRQWEREFEAANPDPEENSDFDSDNEVNPLDTIVDGVYGSSKARISPENAKLKRPIQLSIIGRPNAGKSTLVNGMLRENRVVASDIPGTTRDAVHVQW